MTDAAAFEIAAAASAGTMPARAWARANAASASVQRARKASSPNTPRIAAVPNMSPNKVDDKTPIVIQQPRRFDNKTKRFTAEGAEGAQRTRRRNPNSSANSA